MIPTSPLRVLPQAPSINPALFVSDPSLFERGANAFQQGMQLPLLKEKIKHEKLRLKMEQDKLNFAMSEVGQREQREAAQVQAQTAAAQLALANAQVDHVRAETAANQPVSPERLSGLLANVSPLANQAPDTTQVLAEETVAPAGFQFTGDAAIFNPGGVGAAPAQVVPVVDTPTVGGKDLVASIPVEDANRAVERKWNDFRNVYVASGATPTQKNLPEFVKDVVTYRDTLKPVASVVAVEDDRGLPIIVPVKKVGDTVVEITGKPTIDLETLYKAAPAIKTGDEAFAKARSEINEATKVNAMQNLESIQRAGEMLAKAESEGTIVDRTRLAQLLPERWLNLLAPSTGEARLLTRRVVQQSLRETLGGAFAAVEGEGMMDRSFNVALGPRTNSQLLEDIYRSGATAIRNAEEKANYFDRNRTLAGFKGPEGFVTAENHPGLRLLQDTLSPLRDEPAATPTQNSSAADKATREFLARLKKRG